MKKNKEVIVIHIEITNIVDSIDLGKLYDENKRYNIDLKKLNKLVEPLMEFYNMIGMESIKQDIDCQCTGCRKGCISISGWPFYK